MTSITLPVKTRPLVSFGDVRLKFVYCPRDIWIIWVNFGKFLECFQCFYTLVHVQITQPQIIQRHLPERDRVTIEHGNKAIPIDPRMGCKKRVTAFKGFGGRFVFSLPHVFHALSVIPLQG